VEDTLSGFKSNKKPAFTPPADLEYSKTKPTGRFKKADRVHAFREQESTDEKLMFPEAGESLAWTLDIGGRAASEQEDEDIEDQEEIYQGKVEEEMHLSAPVELYRSVQEREDAWLAGVQHSPDRTAVCFKFANYGRCD